MQDLIERLEKATGPNRELDQDIWDMVGSNEDSSIADGARLIRHAPSYTSSLDAALTLVPENHRWTLCGEEVEGDGNIRKPSAHVSMFLSNYAPNRFKEGATTAIALCIAALKARMAVTETTVQK